MDRSAALLLEELRSISAPEELPLWKPVPPCHSHRLECLTLQCANDGGNLSVNVPRAIPRWTQFYLTQRGYTGLNYSHYEAPLAVHLLFANAVKVLCTFLKHSRWPIDFTVLDANGFPFWYWLLCGPYSREAQLEVLRLIFSHKKHFAEDLVSWEVCLPHLDERSHTHFLSVVAGQQLLSAVWPMLRGDLYHNTDPHCESHSSSQPSGSSGLLFRAPPPQVSPPQRTLLAGSNSYHVWPPRFNSFTSEAFCSNGPSPRRGEALHQHTNSTNATSCLSAMMTPPQWNPVGAGAVMGTFLARATATTSSSSISGSARCASPHSLTRLPSPQCIPLCEEVWEWDLMATLEIEEREQERERQQEAEEEQQRRMCASPLRRHAKKRFGAPKAKAELSEDLSCVGGLFDLSRAYCIHRTAKCSRGTAQLWEWILHPPMVPESAYLDLLRHCVVEDKADIMYSSRSEWCVYPLLYQCIRFGTPAMLEVLLQTPQAIDFQARNKEPFRHRYDFSKSMSLLHVLLKDGEPERMEQLMNVFMNRVKQGKEIVPDSLWNESCMFLSEISRWYVRQDVFTYAASQKCFSTWVHLLKQHGISWYVQNPSLRWSLSHVDLEDYNRLPPEDKKRFFILQH